MLWLVVAVGFIVSAGVVWLMVVSFRFLFALASCFSHISILSDIETFSRAKRWPVVGARLIAPTGWGAAHADVCPSPPPLGAINLAPTGASRKNHTHTRSPALACTLTPSPVE